MFYRRLLLVVLGCLACSQANAYIEDLCFYRKPQINSEDAVVAKPFNCLDFQCDDGVDSGDTKPQCLVT